MKKSRLVWILLLVLLASIYYFRHYLFTEIPKYSGSYSMDQAGREKGTNDSIAFIAHKFVDEMKTAAQRTGKNLDEATYNSIESQLSECVRESVRGKDTNALGLQEFINTYFNPCAEKLTKSESGS